MQSMRHRLLCGAMALTLLALTPEPARADTFLTPFLGVSFRGAASEAEHISYGASALVTGKRMGLEIEFARTPEFFASIGRDHRVTTVMGRFVVTWNTRGRGLRPFLAAGAGIVRTTVVSGSLFPDYRANDAAFDAGGGAQAFFFSRAVGLRGDIRYIRKIQSQDDTDGLIPVSGTFDFWRATIGACFAF